MQRAWLALLLLCTLGCSASRDRAADAGRDAALATAEQATIALTGVVEQPMKDAPPATHGPRLDNVEVCQDNPRRCVVANVDGWFTLDGLVPESEILLVYRKDGFAPALQPIVTPRWSSVIGFVRLVPWDDSQPSLRAGRAVIVFGGYSGGIGHDVRVALEPSSGERPLFTLASGDTVLDVPAGQAAVAGVYDDVEPRDEGYELVYEHAHGDCKYFPGAYGGWPSASGRPNATRVPARAGHVTAFIGVRCTDDFRPAVDADAAAAAR
jgi:hypothetical protein